MTALRCLFLSCMTLVISSCEPKLSGSAERQEPERQEQESGLIEKLLGYGGSLGLVSREYPIKFTISNASGKRLEGHILGKEGQQIVFQRGIDNKRYQIALSTLSSESQKSISKLDDGGEISFLANAGTASVVKPATRPMLGQDFSDDLDQAFENSKISGKPVLLFLLRGTDPSNSLGLGETRDSTFGRLSKSSLKLKNSVISDRRFKEFAREHFEVVVGDVLVDRGQNWGFVSERFKVDMYPTTLVINQFREVTVSLKGYSGIGPYKFTQRLAAAAGVPAPKM